MLKFAALCLLLAPVLHVGAAAADEADPFTHPPALEADVRFWIRVYTEVTTDQGLLHDDWNLKLVYEVLRFDPASSPAQRPSARRMATRASTGAPGGDAGESETRRAESARTCRSSCPRQDSPRP